MCSHLTHCIPSLDAMKIAVITLFILNAVLAQTKRTRAARKLNDGKTNKCPPANLSDDAFSIALWGDLPYQGDSVDVFDTVDEWGARYRALSETINEAGVAFSMHTGDVKGGSTPCGELNYKRFEDIMNSFTLGDNCWTDCHRLSAGNYDPLERLSYLRKRFYDEDGFTVFGEGYLKTSLFDKAYPEIHYWSHNDVMFVNAHVVGSNNALYDGIDRDCNEYLAIIDPECKKATAEYEARDDVSNAAITYGFDQAKMRGSAAVVILIQANIFGGRCGETDEGCTPEWPIDVSTGFRRFWENLKIEVESFGKPCMLVFGDSHTFQVLDNPGGEAPLLHTVMVPGSRDIGWVHLTIDPRSEEVFYLEHIDNNPDYPEAR